MWFFYKRVSLIYFVAITMAVFFLSEEIISAKSRFYEPSLDDTHWQVDEPHPLHCMMTQQIPLYGTAYFMQNAGYTPTFKIDLISASDSMVEGKLLSSPPMWLAQLPSRGIKKITINKGIHAIRLETKFTRWILSELEEGWQPTIEYPDWSGSADSVSIKLSAVNFQEVLKKYTHCLAQLLPFSFDDIRLKTIFYEKGSSALGQKDAEYLDRIARYISVDKTVQTIVLQGYSDSLGSKRNNYLLSIDRLNAVQMYLKNKGVNEKMFEVTAYGKRDPIANNSTAGGRAKNRRVTIELKK